MRNKIFRVDISCSKTYLNFMYIDIPILNFAYAIYIIIELAYVHKSIPAGIGIVCFRFIKINRKAHCARRFFE